MNDEAARQLPVLRKFGVKTAVLALVAAFLCFISTQGANWVPRGSASIITNPVDFRAFQCATKVMLANEDPYQTEPLRACEQHALADVGLTSYSWLVVPVLLPPFAIAEFAPFVPFHYVAGSILFALLEAIATFATIIGLHRLVGFPLPFIAALTVAGLWVPAVAQGQIAPLVAGALVYAASSARQSKTTSCSLGLFFSAIEPHVASAAFLGALVHLSTRKAACMAVAALALLTLAIPSGLPLTWTYLTTEFKLIAPAELLWLGGQYGTASWIHAAGLPRQEAIAASGALWAIVLALGVATARRLAERARDPAIFVLVPVALALWASPYLHATQVALAMPGALLIASRFPAARGLAVGAAIMLSIPWNEVYSVSPYLGAGGRATLSTFDAFWASEIWRTYVTAISTTDPRPPWVLAAMKFPTWLGEGLLLWSAAVALRGSGRTRRPCPPEVGFARL